MNNHIGIFRIIHSTNPKAECWIATIPVEYRIICAKQTMGIHPYL
jgi:hypothetical protein